MSGTLSIRVITPDRILLDTTCATVSFPTVDGSVGILSGHAPMVAAIGVGELAYKSDAGSPAGSGHSVFVAGGFAEVRDNVVRIVTDTSEPASEIDVERAVKAAERARRRLAEFESNEGEKFDVLRARASLTRALMRELVAKKRR
ncbi:MAG: F-type H+-transporting ATPase subunit epsilon [Planctomycetota bacterium]|jgi:F-type H+-transporting ATPase subunit epsilon